MHPPKCRHYSNPAVHGKCLGGKNCNFLHDPAEKSAYEAWLQQANSSPAQARLSFTYPGFCPYGIPVSNSFDGLNNCPASCTQPFCAKSHVSFDPSTDKVAIKHESNPTVVKWDLKNSDYEPKRTDSQRRKRVGTCITDGFVSWSASWFHAKSARFCAANVSVSAKPS